MTPPPSRALSRGLLGAVALATLAACAPIADVDPEATDPDVIRTQACAIRAASNAQRKREATLRALTATAPPRQAPTSEVAGSVLRLLYPGSSASFARESSHAISWAVGSTPDGAEVVVEQSDNGGSGWSLVGRAPAQAGRVVWRVPADGAAVRRVRLTPSWPAAPIAFDVTLTPSQRAAYRWVCIADTTVPPTRDGAGSLVYKDKMWILGGWNPAIPYFPLATGNDVWSSTDGAHWTQEKQQTYVDRDFDPALDWEGRHTAGYAVFDGKMWVLGGDPLQRHYQTDAWYSTDGRTWTRAVKTLPWGNRALFYTLVFQDRLWVLGGQTMPDFVDPHDTGIPYRVFDDVWVSRDGVSWSSHPVEGPHWQPRAAIIQSATLHGKMWVIGGGTYEAVSEGRPNRDYFTDVWSSPDGTHWDREAAATPWTPRQYQSLASWDGKLWVISGYSAEGNQDGAWYSADGKNWYDTETPWGPRHASSVWVYKDAVWLSGGGDHDMWRLERGEWSGP